MNEFRSEKFCINGAWRRANGEWGGKLTTKARRHEEEVRSQKAE